MTDFLTTFNEAFRFIFVLFRFVVLIAFVGQIYTSAFLFSSVHMAEDNDQIVPVISYVDLTNKRGGHLVSISCVHIVFHCVQVPDLLSFLSYCYLIFLFVRVLFDSLI